MGRPIFARAMGKKIKAEAHQRAVFVAGCETGERDSCGQANGCSI